jgi:cupredoxin-like protein
VKTARPATIIAAFAAALAATLACSACGSVARVGADRTLQVALSEYRLRPNNVTAPSGTLTIVARNFGRMTHNLEISNGAGTITSTPPLSPGKSATITVTLTPGTYTMASTILSDQDLGAYGTLKITRR